MSAWLTYVLRGPKNGPNSPSQPGPDLTIRARTIGCRGWYPSSSSMSGTDVVASQSGGHSPKVLVASGATAGQYELSAAHSFESSRNGFPSPNEAKKSVFSLRAGITAMSLAVPST